MNRNTDRENFIPFARPSIGKEEEEAVIKVLRSGWLTTGKIAEKFETEFAGFVGSKYAAALNSATAGLHLALEAAGIKRGDRVITTPFTFASTAEVIRYLSADPIFADIEEETGNISPDLMFKTLSEYNEREKAKIKAVIPVHFAGLPCSMEEIKDAADKFELQIIEDSAHAFPVKLAEGRYKGRYAGTVGDMGVYSFYATKTITTGEGGMLVTNSKTCYERVKVMRLHGIDRDVFDRYNSIEGSWKYDITAPGFKYNMTDLAAALGLVQLKNAVNFLEKRRAIARYYIETFSQYDFLKIPDYSPEHAWHLFVIRIAPEKLTIGRDGFIELLKEEGIGTSVHFIPLHIMTYYKKRYGFKENDFPESFKRYRNSISIPIYPGLSDDSLQLISETVVKIGKKYYKKAIQ
ncbi:MAG: DegT/DnrJ/EryC1/StrS aminotransferase family protein [Spirochaetales bacterium]|nr:DegT/DnrJ/EryC1/StrS aminotransferase family protein [Spirochaetales bacterium]